MGGLHGALLPPNDRWTERSNHRLERTVIGGWSRAAGALRYCAHALRLTRLRAAAQPQR